MQVLSRDHAGSWLQRWDTQQERTIPDREERFRVVADVVENMTAGVDRPLIVDVGCGPGSLSFRLAERLPHAEIVGIDADPALLAIGNARAGGGVRLLERDVTEPGWAARIGVTRPWDAVVSSTALHWLESTALADFYRTAAEYVRPGGVFVNADHLRLAPELDALARSVRARRAERAKVDEHEDWAEWWTAFTKDPVLAQHVGDRTAGTTIVHSAENELTVHEHAGLLTDAGFGAAGPVWQFGDDHVLVAIR